MVERRIDMAHLLFCWQDDTPDNSYYLDRRTGDIKLVNRNLLDLRDLTDEVEKDRERYLYLPKPNRQTELNNLHDFAESITDEKLKRVIDMAFESPHVLLSFRKILESHPDLRKELDTLLEERALERIDSWLKANFQPKVWENAIQDDEDLEDDLDDDDDLDFRV